MLLTQVHPDRELQLLEKTHGKGLVRCWWFGWTSGWLVEFSGLLLWFGCFVLLGFVLFALFIWFFTVVVFGAVVG